MAVRCERDAGGRCLAADSTNRVASERASPHSSPMRIHPLGSLDAVLPLPDGSLPKDSLAPRMQTVSEAKGWPVGVDKYHQAFERLYVVRDWELGLGKPGKEVTRKHRPNSNDMTPTVWRDCVRLTGANIPATFGEMWAIYERLAAANQSEALEVCARLLYRDAFLLDHEAGPDGHLRYRPSPRALAFLQEQSPSDAALPLDVFHHFLELVALNEDVKYSTLEKPSKKPYDLKSAGRVNNLLTSVHFILVLLGRATIAELVSKMVTGYGVSTIRYLDVRDRLLSLSA